MGHADNRLHETLGLDAVRQLECVQKFVYSYLHCPGIGSVLHAGTIGSTAAQAKSRDYCRPTRHLRFTINVCEYGQKEVMPG